MTAVVDERLRLAGIVCELRRTAFGALAQVRVEAVRSCPRCAAGRGCGAGLIARRSRVARVDVPCGAESGFEIGQPVTVSVAGRPLFRIALAAYGLPLAGIVLGSGAAWLAGVGESFAILAAAGGLAGGAGLARCRLRFAERAGKLALGIEP